MSLIVNEIIAAVSPVAIERFSNECRETKIKAITLTNHRFQDGGQNGGRIQLMKIACKIINQPENTLHVDANIRESLDREKLEFT